MVTRNDYTADAAEAARSVLILMKLKYRRSATWFSGMPMNGYHHF